MATVSKKMKSGCVKMDCVTFVEVYKEACRNDMTISDIAEEYGLSPQHVSGLVRRLKEVAKKNGVSVPELRKGCRSALEHADAIMKVFGRK